PGRRLLLVPVRDRGQVVVALVRVTGLDADPDRGGEPHRVPDVEPVQRDLPAPARSSRQGQPVIRGAVTLTRTPRGVEVVLGSRAMQARRYRLAVDEDHVVALAVPVPVGRTPQ